MSGWTENIILMVSINSFLILSIQMDRIENMVYLAIIIYSTSICPSLCCDLLIIPGMTGGVLVMVRTHRVREKRVFDIKARLICYLTTWQDLCAGICQNGLDFRLDRM